MEVTVYNQKGEKSGAIELPKNLFEVKLNPDLVYQVATTQMANLRQGAAHTKDRGEVSGGGKKPWRQKGTGRSRHGSTRSPIWRHGGTVFGPRNDKVYGGKINKKMRRKALAMLLSAKAASGDLLVLDRLAIDEPKTKRMAEVVKAAQKANKNFEKGKILVALPEYEKTAVLAGRNLPEVKTLEAAKLNVLELLNVKCLLMPAAAIDVVAKNFVAKEEKNVAEKPAKSAKRSVAKKTIVKK